MPRLSMLLGVLGFAIACTGGDPPLEDAFTRAPAGACDGLDAYAALVEDYVKAYEELDPSWSGAAHELAARRADITTRAQGLATHAWFTAPACATRYAAINQRMLAVQERAASRRAQLEVTSAEAKACLTTCPNGESEAAKACVTSCRAR